MTDFPMYKKYSIYDINGDTVSKETFEEIENLQKELSLLKRENELLTISNEFYANKESWLFGGYLHSQDAIQGDCDLMDFPEGYILTGGKLAREVKTKIKNLREGKDD